MVDFTAEMPSSKGWVCFRTARGDASRDGVYWFRLAIGEENKSQTAKPFRWFSNDQYSDLKSAIVGLNSHLYTLGGTEEENGVFNRASSRVYRCNMSCVDDDDLVWERCASMLVPRKSPRAVVVAGKIFVFGGIYPLEHGNFGKWVEVFDPAKETWEFLPSPVLDGRRVSLYNIVNPFSCRGGVWNDDIFTISVVVFGGSDDQILFSSHHSSYLYNVRDNSLQESPYLVHSTSSLLPHPNRFDHRPPGVTYSFDWNDGSLYGHTIYGHTMCEEDPSTIRVCHDSFLEGTLFAPHMSRHQPRGSTVVASFSGHGGVFDGRLHAHVLLLEFGNMRDASRTNTICYRHLVYSETGFSDDGGALLLGLRIKNTSMFLLKSDDFLIDGVIVGGKDDGSDQHRTLELEKHEVRSLMLREKCTNCSQKRKKHESHCRSSTSESVPILCYLGGNIKHEDPIGYVGGTTELITVDRLTTTYVSLVHVLLELLDTEHGGQPRFMNLIFKCPVMDSVSSGFLPIALTNDEQVQFMLDIQIKHPNIVVVELFVELK